MAAMFGLRVLGLAVLLKVSSAYTDAGQDNCTIDGCMSAQTAPGIAFIQQKQSIKLLQDSSKQPASDFSDYTKARDVEDPHSYIGGAWNRIGEWQFNFLLQQGLKPSHLLLDMGCGCLRGGVHFIPYLDAGNYYGIDINDHLLEAGYTKELNQEMQAKLPRDHLHACGDFDASFWGTHRFDYALSVSMWTHLPVSEIRKSLKGIAPAMRPGGQYFSSVFHCSGGECSQDKHQWGKIHTSPDHDPYHVNNSDLSAIADELGIKFEYIGNVSHPRNQMMTKWTF